MLGMVGILLKADVEYQCRIKLSALPKTLFPRVI